MESKDVTKKSPRAIAPADFLDLNPGDVCETFFEGKITVIEPHNGNNFVRAQDEKGKTDIFFNFEINNIVSKV